MKLEVTINRKFYISVFVTAILLLGGAAVFAYNYQINDASDPSAFGHSLDEMDWTGVIPGNVSAEGFCIGDSCIDAWPSGGVSGVVAGKGIVITDTSDGIMINATAVPATMEYLPGMHCGIYTRGVTYSKTVLCNGMNPQTGCPSGFVQVGGDYDSNDNRYFYTCVKE